MFDLSIITPSFNQGKFITQTLQSIIIPNNSNFKIEHIIFDNLSTDNTDEVIKNYIKNNKQKNLTIKYFREKDRGQSDAINKGWKIAKGKILTYINSDDFYEPGTLTKVIEYFQKHPKLMWAYGGYNLTNFSSQVFKAVQPIEYSYTKLLDYCNIGQPSCFFREEIIEEIGLLDEHKHLAMDYDLWLRFAQKYDPNIMPFVVANMRYHSDAKSSRLASKQLREMLCLNSKYTRSIGLSRLRQYFYFMRGMVAVKLGVDQISRSL